MSVIEFWRRRWRWIFWPAVFLVVGGLVAIYIFKDILPYSTRYNDQAKLSTTPNGVSTLPKNSKIDEQQVPAAVRLTVITGQAPAGQSFEQGASFRIEVLDKNQNVIKSGSAMTVTLSSSSVAGKFDSGVAAYLPDGRLTKTVRYFDTLAGTAQVSAFVSGLTGSTLAIQIKAAIPTGITDITPAWRQPAVGQPTDYAVSLIDSFGNLSDSGTVHWTVVTGGGALPTQSADVAAGSDGSSHFSYTPAPAAAGREQTLNATFAGVTKQLVITPAAQ